MKIKVAKMKILALEPLGKALELFDIKIHGQLVEQVASLPCLGNILNGDANVNDEISILITYMDNLP